MLGKGNHGVGVEPFAVDAKAIDLGTIAAGQILDEPVARLQRQTRMLARYIGKPQYDVTTLAAPDDQFVFLQDDRFTTAGGYQFSKLTHRNYHQKLKETNENPARSRRAHDRLVLKDDFGASSQKHFLYYVYLMNASIFPAKPPAKKLFDWQAAGFRYFPYNEYLRDLFGGRVQKISLDGGFTCPNVDGTVAVGGCTFCDNRSFSPSRRVRRSDIGQQIQRGIEGLRRRYSVEKFLGYFQPATNTYAPVPKLRALYEEALSDPHIVGLVIGTRPDCVPNEVLDLIDELAAQSYVSLEIGMQTIHDASLDWMNRGHHHDAFLDCMARLVGRKFHTSVHVMLGLPGETREMMHATADEVARWRPAGVKIHNLYAVKRTELEGQVARGEVRLMELEEYLDHLADFIERLPPDCVIERISGDAPPDSLIAPQWCLHKGSIKSGLIAELERRGTIQGSRYAAANL